MTFFSHFKNLFRRSSKAIHANSPNGDNFFQNIQHQAIYGKASLTGFLAFLGVLALAVISIPIAENYFSSQPKQHKSQDVLGTQTSPLALDGTIVFSIPAIFNKAVTFANGLTVDGDTILNGSIKAANIVYGVAPGAGISVTTGQNPTITNTGVTSLQGKTGDVSLIAGSGISISGNTITNSAPATTQNVFTTVTVGTTNITAGSSTDTLSVTAGTGITLSADTSNKKLTISSSGSSGTNLSQATGTLGVTNGGTGVTTVASGALLYGNGTSALVPLPIGNNNAVLTSNGSVPTWSANIPVASGGTGTTTFTSNGVLYGNGTGAIQATAAGTNGQVLIASSSGNPIWSNISAGSGSCTNCLASNPTTTQSINPTGNVTGLTIAQTTTASPSADIFSITNSAGTVKYIQVDANGNVILNNNDLQLGGNINMKIDDINLANTVDTFVYDTASDVDAGAWTNNGNAQASSWYNESIAPTGNCVLGQSARCATRLFPKKVIFVATTTHLYIFDAQNDSLWMTFNVGTGFAFNGTSVTLSSVYALNGIVYVGTATNGLIAIDFINDSIYQYDYNTGAGGRAQFLGNLSQRNSNIGFGARQTWGQIASNKVNGVFARVINGKTYVAVSTLGGASIIDVSDQKVVRYIDN